MYFFPKIKKMQKSQSFRVLFTAFLLFGLFCLSSCQVNDSKFINGYPLPDLTLPDLNGNAVTLSEINKDKIVLVEFWASWCEPCRVKHPELNRIYQLYKNQEFLNANGFEILYVNLDTKKEDWEKAMKKDGIDNWKYHVADLAGMKKSDLPERFQFEQIPTAYLVDANGIIIGKDLIEHRLFHELKFRMKDEE